MLESMWRKRNPWYCWRECKWVQPLRKRLWSCLIKLNIALSNDTAIPFLGMYQDKTKIQKDPCTPMFIAALFTIAKRGKQPQCPSTEEQIKKMWCTYTMECYSAFKKEWNHVIYSDMDATRDYHTRWSKSQRERQILHDITYVWNLKYDTNEPVYKTEADSQT